MSTEEALKSNINTEEIKEAIREEVQKNAVDPKVLAEEVDKVTKAQKEEEDSIVKEVASNYEDFFEVYTNDKFAKFQKENKDEASDIVYFYQQGDKARAYERAYQALKKWDEAKSEATKETPPAKEQKKEQPLPEDRDPSIVGGTLKDPVGVPPMNTIGVLQRKHPSLQGSNDSLVKEGKVRVPRTHAEVRAIRNDALNRIKNYSNE